MGIEYYDSVWDAIEDTPEEALNMRLRSELMQKITSTVRGWGTTQVESARRLGITQPRLNDLLSGKINKFSLDALIKLTGPTEIHVELALSREGEAA